MHPNVLCSTIYNIQAIESIEVFIDRWLDNEDTTYTLNLKKNDTKELIKQKETHS